jgi:hypothetical protein
MEKNRQKKEQNPNQPSVNSGLYQTLIGIATSIDAQLNNLRQNHFIKIISSCVGTKGIMYVIVYVKPSDKKEQVVIIEEETTFEPN